MNIFATSKDPTLCATILDDGRVIKMCLETAQLLSTALSECGHSGQDIYQPTHKNHPCSLWARETKSNFIWLVNHGLALCEEYFSRFKKEHACRAVILECYKHKDILPMGAKTPFVNCTPYKDMETIAAYQKYMLDKWKNDHTNPGYKLRWTNRNHLAYNDKTKWMYHVVKLLDAVVH